MKKKRTETQNWLFAGALLALTVGGPAWMIRKRIHRVRGTDARPRHTAMSASRRAGAAPAGRAPKPETGSPSPQTPLRRLALRKVYEASPERVFAYFTAFDSFPYFLDGVSEVHRMDPGRFFFILEGHRQEKLVWKVDIVRLIPDEYIEWRTLGGSDFQCEGSAWFVSKGEGRTLVDLEIRYGAGTPASLTEHVLEKDFPILMERDAARMKDLIETGSAYI